jgi:alpha-beta hydrolase superfamily lysophospholipase
MADPLAYKGYVTARWGAEMLGAMDRIKSDAATKTAYPFLIIYGTDDIATNMAGGDYLVQHATNSKYA